jgi:riboflavin synthase
VGLVYDPKGLSGVTIVRLRVPGVLQLTIKTESSILRGHGCDFTLQNIIN